jgi:uncharacterized protein YndB with AHSA1/START domain
LSVAATRIGRVTSQPDLDILITRDFAAPIGLVFDVFTKPEHMVKTIAPFGEEVTKCEIDLRVGGEYHYIFKPDPDTECSFRGTFLEVEAPNHSVQTWRFDGWPDVEAVESTDFHETDGVTTMTYRLSFRDQAGRDRMGGTDALAANFDHVEDLLRTLLADGSGGGGS